MLISICHGEDTGCRFPYVMVRILGVDCHVSW